MLRRARRFIGRVRLFAAIVWRPVTGPVGGEAPMTAWQVWWAYGLDIRTAWEIAGIAHGRGR